MDVQLYRQIVLNNNLRNTRVFMLPNILMKYKHMTSYSDYYRDGDNDKFCHIIGYNIKTDYGNTFLPVFNHDLGRKRITLNAEIKDHYDIHKINILYQIGMPLTACNIISKYLRL